MRQAGWKRGSSSLSSAVRRLSAETESEELHLQRQYRPVLSLRERREGTLAQPKARPQTGKSCWRAGVWIGRWSAQRLLRGKSRCSCLSLAEMEGTVRGRRL